MATGTEVAEPLRPTAPAHAPPAVQDVMFPEVQRRVTGEPKTTVVGETSNVSVGTGGGRTPRTEIVTVLTADPHVSVYLADAVRGKVVCEPLLALGPDHAPLAVHELALVDDQVKVEVAPEMTVVGFAVSVTVGTGGGGAVLIVTVTVVTADPQLSV